MLNSEQFQSKILSVRIEGHTSSEWSKNTVERKTYLNNMALSQARSSAVLHYVLDTNLNGSYQWIRNHLVAVGYSSSKIKFGLDGKEDKILSRRVEFKVVTNAQEQLYDLVSLVSKAG